MNKRILNDERAVSGLIGEIMLIGIVIVAIGLITVSTYSYLNKDPSPPHIEVNGLANLVADEIYLKHQGGESIEGGNLRVLVNVDGTTLKPFDEDTSKRWGIRIRGQNDAEENFDRWTLGDILVLATNMAENPVDLTEDSEIRVTIVHRASNRVVVSGEVFGGLFGDKLINTTLINMVFEIVNPADGEWVSGTVPIEAHVTGTDGYESTDFSISSVSSEVDYSLSETDDSGATTGNKTSYTHNWNTTDIKCGNHTISATACDSVWLPMTDQITVCVCNLPGLGFWRFDNVVAGGIADDSSCNRNHGTIVGNLNGVIDGTVYAYQFNGSGDDYVGIANSTSLAMTNETKVEAWVNSSDAGEQYILAKGDVVFESRSGVVEGGDTTVKQDVSLVVWPTFGGTLKRAQTFKQDNDAALNVVRVYIKNIDGWKGTTTGDINVIIHADDGTGTQPGAAVASATILDTAVSTSYAWIDTNFNCDLTGGDTYWLVLESPDGCYDGSSYYWGAGSTWPNGPYPSGEAWDYNGGSWTKLGDVDMTFQLNTTTEAEEGSISTYTDRISMPDPDNFKYLVYYGQLNYSGLEINWSESGLEMVMVRDNNSAEIREVHDAGVDVYYYIVLGSSYNDSIDKDAWQQDVTDEMNATFSYVDGYLWDELSPGYYDRSNHTNYYNVSYIPESAAIDFNKRLDQLNAYAHINGKKTVANGVRHYAVHNGSDYYMWESFVSTYNCTASPIYYCYGDFFQRPTWDNTPYTWVNGIERWEYLRNNNVLNKTLAHCFGDPLDDNKSIYDYIASRVLGLKGFSYADVTNFANGTTAPLTRLAEGVKWDLGTRMSYDVGITTPGCLSGRFTNGYVMDYANWSYNANSTNYTANMISDPLTAHWLNNSSRVTGLDFCLIQGQVDFMHGVLRSSTDLTEWDPGYHVLSATLDAANGTAALYINNTLAAERTFPASLPFDFSNQNLTIGTNGTCGFNGRIDDIRIYSIAN